MDISENCRLVQDSMDCIREWAPEGEKNLQYSSRSDTPLSTKHMLVCMSGCEDRIKPGGTAGVYSTPVPATNIAGTGVFLCDRKSERFILTFPSHKKRHVSFWLFKDSHLYRQQIRKEILLCQTPRFLTKSIWKKVKCQNSGIMSGQI